MNEAKAVDPEAEKIKAIFDPGFIKVQPGWFGIPDFTVWLFLLFYDEKTGGAIWAEVYDDNTIVWKAASSLDLMRDMMTYGMKPVRRFGSTFKPTGDRGDILYCSMPGCADPVCRASKGIDLSALVPDAVASVRRADPPLQAVPGAKFCEVHAVCDVDDMPIEFVSCMPITTEAARNVITGLKSSLAASGPINGILKSLRTHLDKLAPNLL